jgi:hypothetical protein
LNTSNTVSFINFWRTTISTWNLHFRIIWAYPKFNWSCWVDHNQLCILLSPECIFCQLILQRFCSKRFLETLKLMPNIEFAWKDGYVSYAIF